MGVNGLLPRILPSAGREGYDLRALADGIASPAPSPPPPEEGGGGGGEEAAEREEGGGERREGEGDGDDGGRDDDDEPPAKRRKRPPRRRWTRRRARIAVDVNGWVARAAHGHGAGLVDRRHFSYLGRAELRDERVRREERAAAEGDGGGGEGDIQGGRGDDERSRIRRRQQKAEYVSKCVSFVLRRIEFLRDECGARVLPVLDGNTPPCKRDVVRERSASRRRAAERRDREASSQSPAAPGRSRAEGADDDDDGAAGEGDEAARTEAEVRRRASAARSAGSTAAAGDDDGGDRSMRRELLDGLLSELRRRRWPFLVAPYEADGQLGYLASTGAVDLVVTEDSDLIASGAPALVYRLGGWNGSNSANRPGGATTTPSGPRDDHPRLLRGTLLRRRDLGASRGIDLRDFSDGMLAATFVAAGCDYCDSLRGIGIVTARNVVKRAFHGVEADEEETAAASRGSGRGGDGGAVPVLRKIFDELYRSCHRDDRARFLPLDDPAAEGARDAYERSFLAALAVFRHPLVYDPLAGEHVVANDVCDDRDEGVPLDEAFEWDERMLMEYGPYRDLVTKRERLNEVIGTPSPPNVAKGIAEGLIDPRQLSAEDYAFNSNESTTEHETNKETAGGEVGESGDLTQGTAGGGMQLSSQDLSGAGTQQTKSSSGTSGMVSSLSPDLLASPSPQKET
ncbi:hypothetical protein ACHAWF_012711 [Thalassiosira exigua]